MTDFGRRLGTGDMLKSVYDPDKDGVVALDQTEADMTKSTYDTDDDGKVDAVENHASTHQDGGADEISLTGLTGKSLLVDRGDVASADWTVGDFTTDGNWHDLDCSSVVPAGANFIGFLIILIDDAVTTSLKLRKNGNSNTGNVAVLYTQVVNTVNSAILWIPCDTNRVVEYQTPNLTITTLNVTIIGWII